MRHYFNSTFFMVTAALAQNSSSSTGSDNLTPPLDAAIFFAVAGVALGVACTAITLVRFAQRRCAYSDEQNLLSQKKTVGMEGEQLQEIVTEGENTHLLPPKQISSFFRPSTRGCHPKSTGTKCGDLKDSLKEGVFGAFMACMPGGSC